MLPFPTYICQLTYSELGAIFETKLVLANIDKNEIDFSEFKRIEGGELTGEGNGIVNKYYWKTEKIEVVLKSESNWGPKDKSTFHREFKILASLKHRNIIQVYGFTENNTIGRFALVLELADYSLHDCLKEVKIFKHLATKTKYKWLSDFASAIDYLHNGATVSTLHRDLKPENVLVLMKNGNMNDSVLKLTDFGLSSIDTSNYQSGRVVGTCGWGANEFYGREPLTDKTDVFGFGITSMAIFIGIGLQDELSSMAKAKGDKSMASTDFSSIDVSGLGADDILPFLPLLKSCVKMLPAERPSMKSCRWKIESILESMAERLSAVPTESNSRLPIVPTVTKNITQINDINNNIESKNKSMNEVISSASSSSYQPLSKQPKKSPKSVQILPTQIPIATTNSSYVSLVNEIMQKRHMATVTYESKIKYVMKFTGVSGKKRATVFYCVAEFKLSPNDDIREKISNDSANKKEAKENCAKQIYLDFVEEAAIKTPNF